MTKKPEITSQIFLLKTEKLTDLKNILIFISFELVGHIENFNDSSARNLKYFTNHVKQGYSN